MGYEIVIDEDGREEEMYVKEEPDCYECGDTGTVVLRGRFVRASIDVEVECEHGADSSPINRKPGDDPADDPWNVEAPF